MTSVSIVQLRRYERLYLHLFLIVFLNCYSAIRLLSRKSEIKLSSVQFKLQPFCLLTASRHQAVTRRLEY